MEKNTSEEKTSENKTNDDPVKRGKEAIKMHKDLFDKEKKPEEKDEEEEKDAEKWHNEG